MVGSEGRLAKRLRTRSKCPEAAMFSQSGADFDKFSLKCRDAVSLLDPQAFESGKRASDSLRRAGRHNGLGKVRTIRKIPFQRFWCRLGLCQVESCGFKTGLNTQHFHDIDDYPIP